MEKRVYKQLRIPIQYLGGILGFLSVVSILFSGYQKGASGSNILKICILSLILISIIAFYIQSQEAILMNFPYFNEIFIFLFFASQLLILFTKGEAKLHMWLLGGLSIAMLFDVYLGYLVTYNMIFLASFIGGLSLETIIYLMIIGTLLCLLSNYYKNSSTAGYAIIIIISMQIVLLFIIHSFLIKEVISIDAVYSVISSLMAILGGIGSHRIYSRILNKKQSEHIETDSLEAVLKDDFPLLERLKTSSPKLYNHSLLISEMACQSAKVIGADELKAKAGGMYHEIGRLVGKQYVEEGLKLADAYLLPSGIKDIIKQHNLKYEKPKTREAAIVMLAVSFVSTKEYLEKNMKNESGETKGLITNEKIVENVFQLRLTKGSLDESGLTVNEFNLLKEFYLQL